MLEPFTPVPNSDAIVLSSGRAVARVHSAKNCAGSFCPLHNPSEHALRELPLDFNGVHMVRLSPYAHGGVLIDPDDYVFTRTGTAILRNSAYCRICETTVESKARHDFTSCTCGNIFVDGGYSYIRQGWAENGTLVDTSIVIQKA